MEAMCSRRHEAREGPGARPPVSVAVSRLIDGNTYLPFANPRNVCCAMAHATIPMQFT